MDIPTRDADPTLPIPFLVRNGKLMSMGQPMGHLITDKSYENFQLELSYRWPGKPGNSGVIVHVSKLRLLNNLLPQGIEAQLRSGRAGDFHIFGESLFSDESKTTKSGRRNQENVENHLGEWNVMRVTCKGDMIEVWLNGRVVNKGYGCSVTKGQIAIQSEGAEIEFRKILLTSL